MPIAFYEEEHKTIVRLNPPSKADEYPNGTVNYVAANERAISDGALYRLVNKSEDPNMLILEQMSASKKKQTGLSPLFSHYPKLYPSAQLVLKPVPQIIITDPQDILMMRLSNIDKMF